MHTVNGISRFSKEKKRKILLIGATLLSIALLTAVIVLVYHTLVSDSSDSTQQPSSPQIDKDDRDNTKDPDSKKEKRNEKKDNEPITITPIIVENPSKKSPSSSKFPPYLKYLKGK